MSDLVSQAENEGVTLADVIRRTMTRKEMYRAQRKIEAELTENYAKIGEFMLEVSIPSIEEIMDSGFDGFGVEFEPEMPVSDESELALA